jgi:hypothetical protein
MAGIRARMVTVLCGIFIEIVSDIYCKLICSKKLLFSLCYL